MIKTFRFFCFSPKRFNFSLKIQFSENKTKSFNMEKDAFASWIQPSKKPDSFLTGLHVNNSLYPLKLVFFFFLILKKNNLYSLGGIRTNQRKTSNLVYVWTHCLRLPAYGSCENISQF